jgi:hypothetical protein
LIATLVVVFVVQSVKREITAKCNDSFIYFSLKLIYLYLFLDTRLESRFFLEENKIYFSKINEAKAKIKENTMSKDVNQCLTKSNQSLISTSIDRISMDK